MDVLEGTSTVQNLWNVLPAGVQRRLQESGPRFPRAFRSDAEDESYAHTLDGVAAREDTGLVYDEHSFEYLLDIERRRAENTQQPFLLMLLECGDADGAPITGAAAERLFPILRKCLRETDVVGWYLQDVVVGAALTPDRGTGARHTSRIVRDRLSKAFSRDLPAGLISGLRLHIYEVLGDDELRVESC